MKITPETTFLVEGKPTTGAKVTVFDCAGQQVPYVVSYDTETKEIEIVLNLPKKEGQALGGIVLEETNIEGLFGKRRVAHFKTVLKGSYAEVYGVRI